MEMITVNTPTYQRILITNLVDGAVNERYGEIIAITDRFLVFRSQKPAGLRVSVAIDRVQNLSELTV